GMSIVLICNGGHEYYECGGACDNVCADLHIQNKTNCPIIN
nr:Chain C, Inducible metalloproteinase inhibitor protein [Galleria mellonella]3SSB_D Chain D, Inducible metalloproteinase inhibitor protein [Galleria mellonella]7SKL_B Chain B, IMPI alpha [Galleria mellonella]7SKL_D Chain D, IMPI alpha [Galleria mellonella]7SKM_B Chain B, IMPI alpha [Galleria mellonella]7SKM_D Chain D, IMPI alpha [Galleria mellonella]